MKRRVLAASSTVVSFGHVEMAVGSILDACHYTYIIYVSMVSFERQPHLRKKKFGGPFILDQFSGRVAWGWRMHLVSNILGLEFGIGVMSLLV